MGTRHFYPVEQKDSRIKWELADAETSRKLILALGKNTYGLRGLGVRLVIFFPVAILMALLVGFVYMLIQNFQRIAGTVESVFYALYAAAIAFFSVFLLIQYIKMRPYLYPERQPGIWIFRAKCSDINLIMRGTSDTQRYYAYFQKGGGHISIPIQWSEHQANPRGKEYVFYKFNDRTGNRWAAIAAHELDSL